MESDRDRWNRRYQEGEYAARSHPSQLLSDWLDRLPRNTVLDIACGRGRNAIFLAENGSSVTGIDISDAGIDLARERSSHLKNLEFIVADVDEGLPISRTFDLILMVRFVHFELLTRLPEFLSHGGCILVEEHLQWSDPEIELAGPSNPKFRVAAGQITELLSDLEPLFSLEGLIRDPLGEMSAVSQFIGRKR